MMSYIINLLIIVLLFSGCGSVKKGVKSISEKGIDVLDTAKYKILPKEKSLKKKVLVTPFICAWDLSSDYGTKVSFKFAERLKHMPGDLLVYLPKNPSSWRFEGRIPKLGIINDPDMVKDARDLNMNYLITGVMDVMAVERKTNGVWPFRHYDQVFEAVLIVNVIDTVTGAIVESNMVSGRYAIPLKDVPRLKNRINKLVLKNTISEIIRKQAKTVSEVIQKDIWKGRIIALKKNPGIIRINAGKDVGIEKGMILSVYNWGEEVHSNTGSFRCLGKEIGKIKIIKVSKDYSLAVPLNEADYRIGLPVVFK